MDEPGADLAIALAVASAHSGRALEADGKPLACFGEIGLTGEIRYVAHADRRVAEARKFGLGRCSARPPATSRSGPRSGRHAEGRPLGGPRAKSNELRSALARVARNLRSGA